MTTGICTLQTKNSNDCAFFSTYPSKLGDIVGKKFCKVVDVSAEPNLRRRLFELGFVKGAIVQVINVSPMSRAYLISIQDSVLCIRASVLAHVLVNIIDI